MKLGGKIIGALMAVCVSSAVLASNPEILAAVTSDQPGAADGAITGRYKGAALILQTHKAFDELTLPSGPEVGQDYDSKRHFSKTVTAQGEVTRSIYVSPTGRSVLEVVRNYRDALVAAGFTPVYECAAAACGPAFRKVKYSWDNKATHVEGLNLKPPRRALVEAVFDGSKDVRYSLMHKGGAYVALFGALNAGGGFGDASEALSDRVSVLVEGVMPREMEQNVVVAASAIERALATDGQISLYGLYFDTDKASLQASSTPQLQQMGAYLKTHPSVQVYVVGHTDNQGALEHNLALADARARTVATNLTSNYGIAAIRLIARGLGPLAPVATNKTEAGRAKNRRVVLVLR